MTATTGPAHGRAQVLRMTAFADDPAGGNPAGVVLDASGLDDRTMLAIAADLGYSETAFVTPSQEPFDQCDGRVQARLRFFSPVAEVAFCGHAAIATAVALATRDEPGTIHFITPAGPVRVITTREDDRVTATLSSPPGRSSAASAQLVDDALAALGWTRDDLDPTLPPHVAHAGNDHLVLNVRTRTRLADLRYDVSTLRQIMQANGLTTAHLSWRANSTEFHARDPFPIGGVYEDPATGAAAAAFGAYLNTIHGPGDRAFVIHQGEDMGRPSLLRVTTQRDTPAVDVTGTAVALP